MSVEREAKRLGALDRKYDPNLRNPSIEAPKKGWIPQLKRSKVRTKLDDSDDDKPSKNESHIVKRSSTFRSNYSLTSSLKRKANLK